MKPLLIAAALLGLTACDADVTAKHDATKEKVAITGDAEGKLKFDLPFASGQIKLPQAMMKSADFDIDGVKMYPGATISGFNVNAEDGRALVNIAYNAPAAPDAVRGYFLQQFKDKGVDARESREGIEGKSKDGDRFTMTFTPDGGATKGSVVIDAKGGKHDD